MLAAVGPSFTRPSRACGYKLANDGHEVTAGLSQPPQYSEHHPIHRAAVGSVQELLAALSGSGTVRAKLDTAEYQRLLNRIVPQLISIKRGTQRKG